MSEALKLYGFPTSNFYNKVKLALLEKGVEHTDVRIGPSRDEEFLNKSAMGKIPFIEVGGRFIFESNVILEFLDDVYPERPLWPADPFEAALCREIVMVIDLHLDAPARRIFSATFRGGQASPELIAEVQKLLVRGTDALRRLARFAPFIAGENYTFADASAIATLPQIEETARKLVPDAPELADIFAPVEGLGEYMARMFERPATKKVERAHKAVARARDMKRA
jgi:glutathione S-transferase